MFQAVEIDGEHYWDGGYMGNPALFPLIYGCTSPDVIIVHINPIERDDVPMDAPDILNRINEISFNSSLMREMRAIQFVTDLIDQDRIKEGSLKRVLMHSIEAQDVMGRLGVSSKLNPDWGFLTYLRDIGRERTAEWLDRHYDRIGAESTVDVRARFL
jgi:NTE family protein